jgi:hypothetical protein
VGLTILCFILIAALGLKAVHSPQDVYKGRWIRFPVPDDNLGPRFQEKITTDNTTDWMPHHLNITDFTIRYDDQTLVPTSAFNPYEWEIQEWYATKYPAFAQVYQQSLHVSPAWLTANQSDRVLPVDPRFHVAHCVIVLRRMFIAEQTGTHVTPRDLDWGHIDHCLISLEEYTRKDDYWNGKWQDGVIWETTVVW